MAVCTVRGVRLSGGPRAVADHDNEDRWVRAIEFSDRTIPSIKSTWTIAAMALVALFAIVPVGACATKSNQGAFEMEHQLRYLTEAELIELLSLFPVEGKLEVRVAAGGKLTVRGRREHVSCVREFMQIVERTDVPPDNYVPK